MTPSEMQGHVMLTGTEMPMYNAWHMEGTQTYLWKVLDFG
jgi:hypothetical protein